MTKNTNNPKPKNNNNVSYEAKDIYVLKGLEPVRRRPGMYIGSTGSDGLHHLIWECVDNSLDEAMAGFCDKIEVILLPKNQVQISDNGRGIPIEKHPQTKKSALETVICTLHAGGKFGGQSYKVAGGLHGVGVSVVNALSQWMKVEVCRKGFKYAQEYSRGKPKAKVKKISKCRETGTSVIFNPDPEIFKEIKFDWDKILNHLRQQAYLTKGVKIIVKDKTDKIEKSYAFYFEGGITSYVKYLNQDEELKHQQIFYVNKEKEGILVEVAFQYTDEIQGYEMGFANNIHTAEGGMHLTGFRSALTRTLNDYVRKNGFLKNSDENLTGEDIREGLTVVVSIKLREPQFEGQTKAKLGNPEVRTAVEFVVSEGIEEFLEKNPTDARQILEKCILASKARQAAKAARETVIRRGLLEGLALPGKLADCSNKGPEDSELYIVEGDSAGGCLDGDTKIALTDGRNISFKELVEEEKQGKKNFCYTIEKNGNIGIAPIINPRLTKKQAKVIKIILDNDEEIICTPDHKFVLRNGAYKEAQHLNKNDALMPLYRQKSRIGRRITIEDYEMVFDPNQQRWIFTHLLADQFNLKSSIYSEAKGPHRHHIDFNRLNNNPNNITRLAEEEHLDIHKKIARETLQRPEVLAKLRTIKKSPEYRQRIRQKMLSPKIRKLLSERAKKQWSNQEYKDYMTKKFIEFYKSNIDYQKKNRELLNKAQIAYWSEEFNVKKQSEQVKNYFQNHPEKRTELSLLAKKQWQNEKLREWRRDTTKKQWTPEFREKRKKTYNQTYLRKSLEVLFDAYKENGRVDKKDYNQIRKFKKDKSLIKYETICQRFFGGNEQRLKEAVLNYNHRIKTITPLKEKIDVYDIEVPQTHNFALASGIFVHNSAKQARDRHFQAILPLRGKILNIEKARMDKVLASKEIKALIIALGTAIAEEFDINKLRYHRVIIMCDADSDGNHIRALLLTLFFRYFREIIEKGYLYIAQPPLYRIQKGKLVEYGYSEQDKEKILSSIGKEGINIQRYKGLGEMNPEQLWETTMDPKNRVMKQVAIEDTGEADKIFDILMSDEVLPRKRFIQTHAQKVKNLDI